VKWLNELKPIAEKVRTSQDLEHADYERLYDLLTPFFYRAETVNAFLINVLGPKLAAQLPLVGVNDPFYKASLTAVTLLELTVTSSDGKGKNALLSFLDLLLETSLIDQKIDKLFEQK